MAFDWTTHTFSALIKGGALEIGDGYRAKNDELGGDGPIFLRAGHVSDSGIDFSGVDRFTYPNAVRFGSKLSQVGDVVITTKGNSTGRVTFVTPRMPPFVYSPHLSYWRTKPGSILLPGFLKAWSRSQEFGTQLSALSRSTDMAPYLSLQDQRSLTITVPPVAVQQAISALAIGIDDLIDHNRALADNLEAIARALFKSWFVDFDPVRAKAAGEAPPGLAPDLAALFPARLVDSELGEIPDGWTRRAISDLADIVGGSTPSTKNDDYWTDGQHYWATPKDLAGLSSPVLLATDRRVTDTGLAQISSGLLQPGTVLLSSRAPIGYLAIAAVPVAINQGFIAMKPKPGVSNLYLLYWAETSQDAIVANANGSTFLEISKKNFRPILAIDPGPDLMSAFSGVVGPLFDRVVCAEQEIAALTQLRDLLLPRLISGKLRVEDAEAALEAA